MNLIQGMKWHKPKDKKPEQGKKILCMDRGDFYVAQRFGDYWFSIPFYDSKFSRHDEPEMWSDIDFPEPYKGYIKILVEGELLNIDQIEKNHPDIYEKLVHGQFELFKKMQKKGVYNVNARTHNKRNKT